MPDGVLDLDLVEHGAVVELDEERVADGALRGVVVVDAEALVLDAEDLGPECVDARVGGGFVGAGRWLGRSGILKGNVIDGRKMVDSLALRGQLAKDQRVRDHVVDRVVAVGEVVQRSLLVDDAHGGLLRADADALDVRGGLALRLERRVDRVRGLDGRLRVELGRVRDLEEHVLHDVRRVRDLELERLALEEHVVEAPGLGCQNAWNTDLTALDKEREVDGTAASVACCPGLARAGVGCVAVGTK